MKTHEKVLRTSVAALGLSAIVGALAPVPALAHAKVHCKPETGRAVADPIAFHDQAGPQGHLHSFLGNKAIAVGDVGGKEYLDLVGKPTTCTNTADTAAYWYPTLLRNGQPVPTFRALAYYRNWDFDGTRNQEGSGNEPYPVDMRMVAGDNDAPGGGPHVDWNCNQGSTRPGPYRDPVQANCASARPSSKDGQVYLGAHINFPTCWTGVLNPHNRAGNTADFHGAASSPVKNQVAYINAADQCPAGFPRKLPQLRLALQWDYQGNGRDLTLSSSAHDGVPFNMHSDFWNTWVQTGLKTMVDRCINTNTAHTHGSQAICGD
jgi:hypothetical protein